MCLRLHTAPALCLVPSSTSAGYIDMDEFLVITDKTPDLPTLLRDYEGYGGVGVNWRQFGSSEWDMDRMRRPCA